MPLTLQLTRRHSGLPLENASHRETKACASPVVGIAGDHIVPDVPVPLAPFGRSIDVAAMPAYYSADLDVHEGDATVRRFHLAMPVAGQRRTESERANPERERNLEHHQGRDAGYEQDDHGEHDTQNGAARKGPEQAHVSGRLHGDLVWQGSVRGEILPDSTGSRSDDRCSQLV